MQRAGEGTFLFTADAAEPLRRYQHLPVALRGFLIRKRSEAKIDNLLEGWLGLLRRKPRVAKSEADAAEENGCEPGIAGLKFAGHHAFSDGLFDELVQPPAVFS